MALYSLVIERDGKSYSTQLEAGCARQAIEDYIGRVYSASAAEFFGTEIPSLSKQDIIYVTPMNGLVNMWLACAGREGQYVMVTCARIDPIQEG
jgi:hypothetical protein